MCTVEDLGGGVKRYAVRPEDKYPATVARIKEVLEAGAPEDAVMTHLKPEGRMDVMRNVVRQLRKTEREYPDCWDLALVSNEEAADFTPEELTARQAAMMACDKYWQRCLRAQLGGGDHGGPRLLRIHTLNYGAEA
jgi:hypothetical protein